MNPVNGDRVLALLDRTRLSFVVDHLDVARGWSRVMQDAGREVEVLVKIDVGFHRCGVDPEKTDAADFVARVAELPGLELKGLLSHAGHAYGAASEAEVSAIAAREAQMLTTLRDRIASKGVALEEISVGATPTARFSARLDGITELRPGNYVYYDRMQVGLGAARWEDCALTVLARVVGRPAADRVILDSGSKTLTNDVVRGAAGYGVVQQSLDTPAPDDGLLIERLSEEHATVRVNGRRVHAGAGRSGADHSESRLHRLESRGRGVDRERPGGGRSAAHRRARANHIVESRLWHTTFPAKRSASWKPAGWSA